MGPEFLHVDGRADGAYICTSQFCEHAYEGRKMSSSLFRVAMQRR
jgi:hypothetical protein